MTAIDVALAAAPLVVVPLCRPLLPRDRFPRPAIVGAAAVSFAAAFTVHQHASAVLALPWLAVASITLARIALDALHDRDLSIEALALVAAHGFLVVAAFFALASRAGWIVFGISDPIVELTGVHFHYAGFATMTLALCVHRAARVPVGVARVALVLGFVAPPIVASGFTFKVGTLQIVGAIGMTAFAWTVAGLTLAFVVPHATGRARALLAISSLSVVAPMILAVFWAVGQHYDVPALSIPAMARIHGSLNAIGFVGCGVFGWRAIYADLRSSMTRVQRSDSMR